MLTLAESEAQWLDEHVYNFILDPGDMWDQELFHWDAPKPAVADRATAAALIAAFASPTIATRHAAWRKTVDEYAEAVQNTMVWLSLDGGRGGVPENQVKPMTDVLQHAERAARRRLAEAVAAELGHR